MVNCRTCLFIVHRTAGVFIGLVAVADTLRPEAEVVVSQLTKRNVDVYMITGDNQRTARAIARKVRIFFHFVMVR